MCELVLGTGGRDHGRIREREQAKGMGVGSADK